MIFFGASSLRRALSEFVDHYHREGPHQGLGNEVIERTKGRPTTGTEVHVHERLGGLLRHYRRLWRTRGSGSASPSSCSVRCTLARAELGRGSCYASRTADPAQQDGS